MICATSVFLRAAAVACAGLAAACQQTTDHYVIAASGTSIGLDLSFDTVRQTPQGRLGYHRGEVAVVPSNRTPCIIVRDSGEVKCGPTVGQGAKDTTDVMMELYYGDIFSQNSVIYQRLAVGQNAVTSTGATVLFSKRADGDLDPQAFAAGVQQRLQRETKAAAVVTAVAKDKALDKVKLAQLFDKTSLKDNKSVRTVYESSPDVAVFRQRLFNGFPVVIDELFDALQK